MGTHCSCLFTKTGNSTYIFPEDRMPYDSNPQNIVNNEFTQAINIKSAAASDTAMDGSFIHENKASSNINKPQLKEGHETQSLIIKQWARGKLFRKKFRDSLKNDLVERGRLLYREWINLTANEYVKKAEDISHFAKYDPDAWKKFYSKSDCPFQSEYEDKRFQDTSLFTYQKTKKNNLPPEQLVSYASSYYLGEVNIKYQKHGLGTLWHRNGAKYIGYWNKDTFTGWGRHINPQGTITQAIFNKGIPHGKGDRICLDNTMYTGDFYQGECQGEGREQTSEMIYTGSFKHDKKWGHGELQFKSGDIYIGEFYCNLFQGQGHYIWKDKGNEYTGEYLGGVFHGEGEYRWNDKEYYKGSYVNGIKEGNGEFVWADGRKFNGPFEKGVPHGIGRMEVNGKVFEVNFVNGVLNKQYKGNIGNSNKSRKNNSISVNSPEK